MKLVWKIKNQKDVERGEEYVRKIQEKYEGKDIIIERQKDKIVITVE